jgi:thiol-disulfide isomerase/thioredoxin
MLVAAAILACDLAPAQESRAAVPATPLTAPGSRPASRPKRPDLYDTKTDGKVLVDKALAKAAKLDKRVLLVWGGNWCGWCHKLHEHFAKERETGKLLFNEYEVAWIDVGDAKTKRNEDLLAGYVEKLQGVPYLTVLDSAGKVLTNQETGALEEGDHHDAAKVKAFLEKWRVPPKDADTVFADALAKAKAESKLVFFHVSAPWCGYCHKLEEFAAKPEIAKILGADFVMLKIDNERMTHGADVEKRLRTEKSSGIPWIAFLDADGKKLATGDGPKGNIGCPWEPQEIAWFMGMLRKVRNRMTEEQLVELEAALNKFTGKPAAAESQKTSG